LEIYSGELQQIWEIPAHTTIVGSRIQYGEFHTISTQLNPDPAFSPLFPPPPQPSAQQDVTSRFSRINFYGYHQWQVFEPLQLIGGVTYDQVTFPLNYLSAPVSDMQTTRAQISPKAGLVWTPLDKTAVRFAYTRSLSGANLDQSYQLEPSQVAGFVQSFRNIIPESIAGGNSGAQFETYDLSLEQKFSTGTYVGIAGELLNSTVRRTDGAFQYEPDSIDPAYTYPVPFGTRENLEYQEKSLLVTLNQLVGGAWSFGAKYRLSQAVLHDDFIDMPDNLLPIPIGGTDVSLQPHQRTSGVLHQLDLTANYNLPNGFFAQAEALWYDQSNSGYNPAEPGDAFWQLNAFAGYRAFHRKAELAVGLLNIAGQNYNLNPLNVYDELPRARTLAVRFQLNF
jgi:outer membrane receptor protein involved in Fe transport